MAHGAFTQLSSKSRVFQFAAHTFDACIFEIMTTLNFGGCICITSEDMRINDLTGALNDSRSDFAFLTPSVSRMLDPTALPHLHTLILIGEAVDQHLVELWRTKKRLLNGYGPTEYAVLSTMVHHDSGDIAPATIGYPVGCDVCQSAKMILRLYSRRVKSESF